MPEAITFAATGNVQPYKYNGKEPDTRKALNLYDYGARWYDPALGRFTTIDPLAEKAFHMSPYAYCGNNPMRYADPDGRFPFETIWDIGNIFYDLGSAIFHQLKGDYALARNEWVNVGLDFAAAILPYIPAGTTKALKIIDETTDIQKTTTNIGDALKNRVKLRKDTKQAIMNNAPKTLKGQFVDPNTGNPIRKGEEVFGHKSGQEWSKYKRDPKNQEKTRQEVIKEQNNPDIYQIEDRISNASHKYEEKQKIQIKTE